MSFHPIVWSKLDEILTRWAGPIPPTTDDLNYTTKIILGIDGRFCPVHLSEQKEIILYAAQKS